MEQMQSEAAKDEQIRKLLADHEEIDRLRVQLAGCGVAALGGTSEPASKDAWGWSPAYQDVLDLRIKYAAAQATIAEYKAALLRANAELATDAERMRVMREAADDFRDRVLNQRHQFEEPCLDNDQTNAVLDAFNETIATALASPALVASRSRSYEKELLRRLKDKPEAIAYLKAALEDSEEAFFIALDHVIASHTASVAEAVKEEGE